MNHLYYIYSALLCLNTYYGPWQESITVVLRKPGKPCYDLPKAYRPIALLNMLRKVLSALVTEQLTFLDEDNGLLSAMHFGRWPDHTTTDVMHLLVQTVHNAWRQHKVALALFLDIKGAFPNAVTDCLLHNLKRWRVPTAYVDFVGHMLWGRSMHLCFNDYVSNPINIDNGIGQGDPLSMILYLYYNSDLLDIPSHARTERTMAFVDNGVLITIGPTFKDTHHILHDMMTRPDGAIT
ncbi:hypothetical protein EWM64_g10888 [Hericium alpestre]|uniref:Reverse transcriptase domain-containing protein n=1 Tax=Hericium alpestre TaxID=135208 RepID=A0A4Y9ZF85_9AGAM|nr:hypothetical protein EWM64_g10888 [Hericium alpestre]